MSNERTARWRATAVALALSAALALPSRAAVADEDPKAVVDATASAVLAVLRDQSLPRPEKQKRIEDIVYARIDFPTLSRLVMARNWSRLSAAQQAEFLQEFRKHLSVTYGDNIDNYKNESLEILGEREEARGDRTVHSKILRGDAASNVLVDYRLRQKDGQWRIIDVIVEGVSMVANFRSQFQEIMANGGADKLLQLLREKNARGEPLKS